MFEVKFTNLRCSPFVCLVIGIKLIIHRINISSSIDRTSQFLKLTTIITNII